MGRIEKAWFTPVCNCNDSLVLEFRLHGLLNQGISVDIHIRSRFIQNQNLKSLILSDMFRETEMENLRVSDDGTCQREKLDLT